MSATESSRGVGVEEGAGDRLIPPLLRSSKIQARHLRRLAVVYVRQSSPQQVRNNRESTALQYDLRHRATALGWPASRVTIIDEDQGQSGQTAEGRLGFQRLLAEVGLDHVGIILGLEMSRLARSCKDWHQLLELCSCFGTLLADQDGLYDPTDYNDRLLLGLKGTMSEAELHILRGRLEQGKLNKARRGELFNHPPIGYVRAAAGGFALEPDEQARGVVRLIFDAFDELGSITALLAHLVRHGIRIGVRPISGPDRGGLVWRRPHRATLSSMLHHPIYAGAYTHGRRRTDPRRKVPGRRGTGRSVGPREQWPALLKDRLPAYITWDRYEANLRRLAQNNSWPTGLGPPREGPTLLSGLIACGRCGRRMLVHYGSGKDPARYTCTRGKVEYAEPSCQSLAARPLDEMVAAQLLGALEPASLELSLQAADDLRRDRVRLDRHRRQRLERARYEVGRAARQYNAVDPENRLVARELEGRWEQALLDEREAEECYDRYDREQPVGLTGEDREMITSLSADIPALWRSPATTPADRQEIARHLVERVVVEIRGETEWADAAIHWAGGDISRHEFRRPIRRYDQLRDYDRLLERVVALRVAGGTSREIAERLNREGFAAPSRRGGFNAEMVRTLLSRRGLSGLPAGVGTGGALGPDEWWAIGLAGGLRISQHTLHAWRRRGWVLARRLPGCRGRWIFWADGAELERLGRLRSCRHDGNNERYPRDLLVPNVRSLT